MLSGFHYLIELHDCDSEILKDLSAVETILENAINTAGATEINHLFHQFFLKA